MRCNEPSRHRSIRWRRSSAAPRFRPSSICSAICCSKVETLIIGGGMANTFLAAQGKADRQIAVRKRSDRRRARHPGQGQVARAARSCCRSMRWWRKSSPRTCRPRVVSVDQVGAGRHDPGHRPAQHRTGDLGAGAHPRRWSGTARSAPSSTSRSTTAPSKWPRRWRNSRRPDKLVSFAGGGDTVAALNVAGVTGPLDACVDRGRRFP